jgi:hypothetical protein
MNNRNWIAAAVLGLCLAADPAFAQVPDPAAGAFDRLNDGNQKIARALFEAQVPDTREAMTLDQISAARGGTSWGQVFRQMQTRKLVQAKTLGEALSNHFDYGVPPPAADVVALPEAETTTTTAELPSPEITQLPAASTWPADPDATLEMPRATGRPVALRPVVVTGPAGRLAFGGTAKPRNSRAEVPRDTVSP